MRSISWKTVRLILEEIEDFSQTEGQDVTSKKTVKTHRIFSNLFCKDVKYLYHMVFDDKISNGKVWLPTKFFSFNISGFDKRQSIFKCEEKWTKKLRDFVTICTFWKSHTSNHSMRSPKLIVFCEIKSICKYKSVRLDVDGRSPKCTFGGNINWKTKNLCQFGQCRFWCKNYETT